MILEIISRSISTKVWDRTGIELATPGSAIRHASVARHVTDCATRPFVSAFANTILSYFIQTLALVLLDPDLSLFENTVDPDQLASDEAI